MNIINNQPNWIQYIPKNLPASQLIFWVINGLHFEDMAQYGTSEFHIERFRHKSELMNMLKTLWNDEINKGKIKIGKLPTNLWRIRFIFNGMNMHQISKSKYVSDVIYCVKYILAKSKIVSTPKKVKMVKTPVMPVINTSDSNYKTLKQFCSEDINVAHDCIRTLRNDCFKKKQFSVKEYRKFENMVTGFCNKNSETYPQNSSERAWFKAEEMYKFINSEGKYIFNKTSNKEESFSYRQCVKNHYGSSFTDALYQKELNWFREHNKYTWEDPDYKIYENNLELLKNIEKYNKPIRDYIKKEHQAEWKKYNVRRHCDFIEKKPTDLDYAKYCSDYIQNNWLNILTPNLKSNWLHWSNIK